MGAQHNESLGTEGSGEAAVVSAYGSRAEEYTTLLGGIDDGGGQDARRIAEWASAVDGPVLDLGCGPGRWTAHLAELGHDVLGVDPTREFIEIARRDHPGARFAIGSVASPGVDDFTQGGVLAWYSLIHLEEAELHAALRSIRRMLRRGGRLLLGSFDGPDGEPFGHKVITARTWSVQGMTGLLEDAGFTVIASERRTDPGARPHAAVEAVASIAAEEQIDALLEMVPADGVLALGEPTHGSGNAFRWKMDVVLALAERGALSALAFEDSRAVGRLVDRALRASPPAAVHDDDSARPAGDACSPRGGSRTALDEAWGQGSSLWNVAEIVEGMHRLLEHNRALPADERVRYLGIDIRKPHLAARELIGAGFSTALLEVVSRKEAISAEDADRFLQQCERIEQDARSSARAEIIGHARHLRRYIDTYLTAPDLGNLHRRDTHMAEMLVDQLPDTGLTVLWAHNEHIARSEDNFGGPSAGHLLDRLLGTRYVPVGMLCGPGRARAVDPSVQDDGYRPVALPPYPEDSTEAALVQRGEGLHRADDFCHPGPRRFIGWQIDSSLFRTADRTSTDDSGQGQLSEEAARTFLVARPTSDFDAILYQARSTPADTMR